VNCAIVFCIDDLYVKPFQVFFHSLESTFSIPRGTRVFILHTESLSQVSIKTLESFLRNYGRHVTFLDASHLVPKDLPMSVGDHVSAATFFRLFIAEILPHDIDQAVYLDSDMLAIRSIAQLFEISVQGLVAAVDHCTPGNAIRLWGSKGGSYFQAGILIIPVQKWRDNLLANKFIEVMASQHKKIKWWDQDVLNIALQDNWHRLPIWYNITDPILRLLPLQEIADNAMLIHYNGSSKPWTTHNSSPFADQWFREYAAVFERPFDQTVLFPKSFQRVKAAVRRLF